MTNGNSAERERFEYARSLLPNEMYWGEPITVAAVLHIAEAALSICADGGKGEELDIGLVLRDAMATYAGSRETPDYAVRVAVWLEGTTPQAECGKFEAVGAVYIEDGQYSFSALHPGIANLPDGRHELYTAPQAECAPREAQPVLPIWWSDFITNICDIPGRTSPEGEPEAIIATIDELRHCALASIEAIEDAPASDTAEAAALRAFDKSKLDGYSHDLESYCAGYIDAAPTPERADAEKDCETSSDAALLDALKKIAAIENKMVGSDWEEIEEARSIANAAILAANKEK